MPSLYLDTSQVISLGLLNEQHEFIDFQTIQDKKSGTRIHVILHDFLNKHKLEIKSIESLFILAGPGSYTGMRVSEGIAQILELEKILIYSFYTYQISEFSGATSGQWLTTAFKGQVFVYSWGPTDKTSELCDLQSFTPRNVSEVYYHGDLPKELQQLKSDHHNTNSLIQQHSKAIFRTVKELGLRHRPQYFRLPEQEFAVNYREK
ncbi:MAG: hypothetical protein A2X86_17865 [Bdellovibrionales bacterium GWA2_49_15]|nr:MAG: hypothetical protein A2X86_17865 [Bdellovibrionales bacterium GWA2_49_15]HAZ11591.1 hypothetical protein [Bdellovibrionales bacterium]